MSDERKYVQLWVDRMSNGFMVRVNPDYDMQRRNHDSTYVFNDIQDMLSFINDQYRSK
jgi:hypothetical protein